MRYPTSIALRTALEHRLLATSRATGVSLDRLRRRVVFERVTARLATAEPGHWVVKGGMALECRLRDEARLTKDLDLGLRGAVAGSAELHERLVVALEIDPAGDTFEFVCPSPSRLSADAGAMVTWRTSVTARLGGKEFGRIQLDISPRDHELTQTERIELPNSLDFADIESSEIEIIDVNRHAAEKYHGMLRDFGDRDNSRVRDLVDLVLLIERDLPTPALARRAVQNVWRERDDRDPPRELPELPASWPQRYAALAEGLDVDATNFATAYALVAGYWQQLTQTKET